MLPAAACRIIRASSDVTLPSPLMSQRGSDGRLPAAISSTLHTSFTFPPPGKTSGEIHDRLCQGNDDHVVTLGYGPDFAVIRSRSVAMNIPQMVRELHDELEGAGVNGGGHLVVGSIKFVEWMRTEVLQRLAEMIRGLEVA